MDILLSMVKPWPEMIFTGEKALEFRNLSAKNFTMDDVVYIYESKNHGGVGKIVGYFWVKEILDLDFPKYMGKVFLPYYCRELLKNEDYADKFYRAAQLNLSDIKNAECFALDKNALETMERDGWLPSFDDLDLQQMANAQNIISGCSTWLRNIGFFNSNMETNYKKALVIKEAIQYDIPEELGSLYGLDGKPLTKAPQSWQYISKRKEFE